MAEPVLEEGDDGDVVQPVRPPAKVYAWQQPAEPSAPPPLRRIRLGSAAEIAQQLRRVYREVASGRLSPMEGKRQSAILRDLADLHTASQVQARLDRIEQALVRDRRAR